MFNLIAKEKTWFIAHNGTDIFHNGYIEIGQEVTTGQPEFETFDNEQDYISRCEELKIDIEKEDII